MEKHHLYSDLNLLIAMENAELQPEIFTHEAHLRWGWLLLENNGLENTIYTACAQLKQYTFKMGVADKYNETLTVAAIRCIHHFRLKSSADNFFEFISEAPRLKTSFKELMNTHYSWNIFKSKIAKKRYLEPDLLPFD